MKVLSFIVLVLIAVPGFALAGVPDLNHSYAECAYDGPGMAHIVVLPDGSGDAFDEALDPEGNTVDATLTLTVLDGAYDPIVYFPFEDMWLEALDGGMVSCPGGTCADFSTDMNGMTEWVNPLKAGGYSEAGLVIMISGSPIMDPPVLPISVNSPDITGDGEVTLADLAEFATNYFQGYHFRSDFHRDGMLNLSDLAWMAMGMGAICP